MATAAITRTSLLLLAAMATVNARAAESVPASPPPAPAPFSLQLNLAHFGALGQPFMVSAELFSSSMGEVTCEGEVADAAGRLLLSGKWDLVLDELHADKVIASRSLKPAAAGGAVVSQTVSPLKNRTAKWSWDAQALFTHAGNYRFHLRYGGLASDSELFRIDATREPPTWIHLEVRPDKRRALLGEPVDVSFTVTNSGVDTYPMYLGHSDRGASRTLSFSFSAVRSNGVKCSDPEPLQTSLGGIGREGGLKPGEKEHQEVTLGAYVRFPGPGTYQVTAYHAMGFGTPVAGVSERPFALAGTFSIVIAEPTAADCDRIVGEAIAAKEDCERWRHLAHLHEPAYLEPLRRALVKGGSEYIAVDLVDGIDSVCTTDATAALFACLDDARSQVRRRALDHLSWRMPEVDRSAGTGDPGRAGEEHRLHALFSAQTWDDRQQRALAARIPALIASADTHMYNPVFDMLGRLGTPEAGETIARLADRLVLDEEGTPGPSSSVVSNLQNAAFAFGLVHGLLIQVDAHSPPGRLVCWSYMIAARREQRLQVDTAETDALFLAMLSMPGPRIKIAAFTGLDRDAGARLPMPWKTLFQDTNFDVWRPALNQAHHGPRATIQAIIASCSREGWDENKSTWFDNALQYFADHPAP
jgi:hypothetical protein